MTLHVPYPIGTPGHAWGAAEVSAWRSRQTRKRSYAADVLDVVERLRARFDVVQYGQLDDDPDSYPLFAIKSREWRDALRCVLVTGGVHGYETSGVHGALQFVERHAADYAGRVNLVVVPCVSPWAYERVLVHIDLHETTDTDESEFRPALAARDGIAHVPGEIPDGFYLCGDSEQPQPEFQQAVIAAVANVTHIAPADRNGEIIGSPVVAPGVINYPLKRLGLCASITDAPYKTTTEVYPDSPRVTAEQCNAAQVEAVRAAIDFALARN